MHQLRINTARGRYRAASPQEIMEAAAEYHRARILGTCLDAPSIAKNFVRASVAGYEYEVFGVLWLDNRHRVLAAVELFRGTIDGASVHPREVVKSCLTHNAAAGILYHNHPSATPEPSQADELITRRLIEALRLLDVRILDHLIVGGEQVTSFAERGLL